MYSYGLWDTGIASLPHRFVSSVRALHALRCMITQKIMRASHYPPGTSFGPLDLKCISNGYYGHLPTQVLVLAEGLYRILSAFFTGHSVRDVPFFVWPIIKRVSLLAPSECIILGAISNRQLLWTRVWRFQHLAVSDRNATPGTLYPDVSPNGGCRQYDEEFDYHPSDEDVTLAYIYSLLSRR